MLRTDPAALTVGPTAFVPVPARTDVLPSPRLTANLALAPDLALKASGGWYARVPTLVELFGNRGFLLGTPDLRPERGPNGDFGGVWAPVPATADAPVDRILVEADVFATRARDTIGFITTAGYVTRAANLGRTQTYGAEIGASARFARTLALVARNTRVDTENISDDNTLDGRALPRTPGHRLSARATVARTLAAPRARRVDRRRVPVDELPRSREPRRRCRRGCSRRCRRVRRGRPPARARVRRATCN